MYACAGAVKENGGNIIGIMPERIVGFGCANPDDCDEFIISAEIESDSNINNLHIYYNKVKNEKKIYVNGKQVTKLMDLNKYINTLLFVPSMGE